MPFTNRTAHGSADKEPSPLPPAYPLPHVQSNIDPAPMLATPWLPSRGPHSTSCFEPTSQSLFEVADGNTFLGWSPSLSYHSLSRGHRLKIWNRGNNDSEEGSN